MDTRTLLVYLILMFTLLIAALALGALFVAYHTYGRWLSRRVFALDPEAHPPSEELRDGVDYVPTPKAVVFGHHFTSIAGTGPIVGPAIAVFWGWLPAILWVVIGSIFVGAVHDFGALVVSMRNKGQTIGQIAGRLVSPRVRLLLLTVLFFALMIVLAIFGLVIANLFAMYPASVLSVWIAMPLAVGVGWWTRNRGGGFLVPAIVALGVLYLAVWLGAYHLPITLPTIEALGPYGAPVVLWTGLLLAYCYAASVLPVGVLLQPRDFINSLQLAVAMVLLMAGLVVASLSGAADLASAPAIAEAPVDAPPILPFLFITIACGACSGFHCLVSSGTTSKQLASETDAQTVGYGGMLLEGALAVVVILACCAGVGMGFDSPSGERLQGAAAWSAAYPPVTQVADDAGGVKNVGGWSGHGLRQKVGAFVIGGANFVSAVGVPMKMAVAIIAVLVACFAATTLDTATRLQRYIVQELGGSMRVAALENKHGATAFAVVTGGAVAMTPGPIGPGSGGLLLWPLFGAVNQLLAGLAFVVIVFYLARRRLPIAFATPPMALMLTLPGWAMAYQIIYDFWPNRSDKALLLVLGVVVLVLQAWIVIEALLLWPKVRGVIEEPSVEKTTPSLATQPEG